MSGSMDVWEFRDRCEALAFRGFSSEVILETYRSGSRALLTLLEGLPEDAVPVVNAQWENGEGK